MVRRETKLADAEYPLEPPFVDFELIEVHIAASTVLSSIPVVQTGRNHRNAVGPGIKRSNTKRRNQLSAPYRSLAHEESVGGSA